MPVDREPAGKWLLPKLSAWEPMLVRRGCAVTRPLSPDVRSPEVCSPEVVVCRCTCSGATQTLNYALAFHRAALTAIDAKCML